MLEMSEASDTYLSLLRSLALRGSELDRRPIAGHWPHVGSRYRPGGLMYVGQALDGWDAAVCSARFRGTDLLTEDKRLEVLQGIQSWHRDLPEPMEGVLRHAKRRGSPFWGLGAGLAEVLEDATDPWYASIPWANVYPLGYDRLEDPPIPSGPPVGVLREVQDRLAGPLFRALVDLLDPGRVVVVAGPNFWAPIEKALGLRLEPAPFPLLRAGSDGRRTWIVGYHPAYARKAGKRFGPSAGTNRYYVDSVARAVAAMDAQR